MDAGTGSGWPPLPPGAESDVPFLLGDVLLRTRLGPHEKLLLGSINKYASLLSGQHFIGQ